MGAIPARFASVRLPGKPLLPLLGKPMIEHVYRRARAAEGLARVVVLTDDERIAAAVTEFGGEVELTPADLRSGTDRIAWAAHRWNAGAVVNIQGDEPLIDPEVVGQLARHLAHHPGDPMVTLATPARDHERADPNAVKVVVDGRGYALYFSRSEIPFRRTGGPAGGGTAVPTLKHLGLYGYQRETLLRLAALPSTPLEEAESLEQLRALEHGIPIRVLLTDRGSPGVDTAEDLARVERILTQEHEERR